MKKKLIILLVFLITLTTLFAVFLITQAHKNYRTYYIDSAHGYCPPE